MIYSNEEIELTLNFYSIAKLHIDNLNQALQFKELNDHEKNEYMFYSHIVSKVNYWLKELLPDELEILILRIKHLILFLFMWVMPIIVLL